MIAEIASQLRFVADCGEYYLLLTITICSYENTLNYGAKVELVAEEELSTCGVNYASYQVSLTGSYHWPAEGS